MDDNEKQAAAAAHNLVACTPLTPAEARRFVAALDDGQRAKLATLRGPAAVAFWRDSVDKKADADAAAERARKAAEAERTKAEPEPAPGPPDPQTKKK